jgi:glutathione peroxidase-family protein
MISTITWIAIALLGTRPIWNFFQIKTQEIYNKKKCQVVYNNLTPGIEILNRSNPWMDPLLASLQWLSCNVFEWLQISWNFNEPIYNREDGVIDAFRILSTQALKKNLKL